MYVPGASVIDCAFVTGLPELSRYWMMMVAFCGAAVGVAVGTSVGISVGIAVGVSVGIGVAVGTAVAPVDAAYASLSACVMMIRNSLMM